MEWIQEHALILSAALLAVINILNAVSEHYSKKKPGLARALLLIAELLSVLPSKGSEEKVKLPGVSKPPAA